MLLDLAFDRVAAAFTVEDGEAPPTVADWALPNGSQTVAISGMANMMSPLLPASRILAMSGSDLLTSSKAAVRGGGRRSAL